MSDKLDKMKLISLAVIDDEVFMQLPPNMTEFQAMQLLAAYVTQYIEQNPSAILKEH